MKDYKKKLENLGDYNPIPEPDTPRRSWLYILIAVFTIFGLTFLFQQISEPEQDLNKNTLNLESQQNEIQKLQTEVDSLKSTIDDLEDRLEELERE